MEQVTDATLRLFGHHLVITGQQRVHSRTSLRTEKEKTEHNQNTSVLH